eukprot:2967482-Rhodomonas_salina.1
MHRLAPVVIDGAHVRSDRLQPQARVQASVFGREMHGMVAVRVGCLVLRATLGQYGHCAAWYWARR